MADKKEKNKSIKIKYTGKLPAVDVIGFGHFIKDQSIEFTDPEKINMAKQLLAGNKNFKEEKQ